MARLTYTFVDDRQVVPTNGTQARPRADKWPLGYRIPLSFENSVQLRSLDLGG